MKKDKKNTNQPERHSIEPGHPDFNHGQTGVPDVAVMDEDAKAEKQHEEHQPGQDVDAEDQKLVNEQEQDQVVNDDEGGDDKPKETPKMNDKPKQPVNTQDRG